MHVQRRTAIRVLCLGGVAASVWPRDVLAAPLNYRQPVRAVAPQSLPVAARGGQGVLRLFVSADWNTPQPSIERALIVLHGRLRNAETYNQAGERALAAAGAGAETLLVTPQFLSDVDVPAHALPDDTLRWGLTSWMGGEDAHAPAAISSFDALDTILARLADRARFPALRQIVIAGHSGGGQVLQRYALLGRGGDAAEATGVHVRYVVANPSSYAYFSAERPGPTAGCPDFDRWKYGMHGLPPYAADMPVAAIEARYVARDVIYLLGEADTDPHQEALDVSCEAEAEGPTRLARGLAYVAALRARHPTGLAHRVVLVPGVGHDGTAMLTSSAGRTALFGNPA